MLITWCCEYDLAGLIKCPIILLVMMRSPRFKIGDALVVVYPSQVFDWSGTPHALEHDR
jgi:hypothetical protein